MNRFCSQRTIPSKKVTGKNATITDRQRSALKFAIAAYDNPITRKWNKKSVHRWPSWTEIMDVEVYNRDLKRRISVATLDVLERAGMLKTKRTETTVFVPRNGYSAWDGGKYKVILTVRVMPTRKGRTLLRK